MIATCIIFVFTAYTDTKTISWRQISLPVIKPYEGHARELNLQINEFECRCESGSD